MTLALEAQAQAEADASVVAVDEMDGLSAIHRADCAAAIWRRQPLPSFQDWVDALDPSQLPQTRAVMTPSDVRDAVRRCCDVADTPDGPERAHLIDDVAALANGFTKIVGAPYLRLRLDVVTTNSCRKFHIDSVTSRLICTYRGAGTQYGVSQDGGQPTRVHTAPTGAPIVLRGTLWPTDPPSGLLHRSPPIAGTGVTRLLLVLDPLETMIDDSVHVLH